MKWKAVAYCTYTQFDKQFNSKYKSYQEMLNLTNQLTDNPTFNKMYGTNYYFTHFYNDLYSQGRREQFEEMLEVIKNENIDKIFVFDIFRHLGVHNLRTLSKQCRELNIELLFPYEMKDNFIHKELFDKLAELAS